MHQQSSERFVRSRQDPDPVLPGLEENLKRKKARAPVFASTDTNPIVSPHDSNNPYIDADMPDVDMEVLLSELLNYIAADRKPEFDRVYLDLFAELQASLTCGEIPFSTPLVPGNDEHELFDDSAPDVGIQIPGECNI